MSDLETKNRTLAVNLKQSEESFKQKLAAAEVRVTFFTVTAAAAVLVRMADGAGGVPGWAAL
jgi:hypothetical protein